MAATEWADRVHGDVLCLFDVDGTLTPARRTVQEDMVKTLADVRKKVVIGFVGGSDLSKQKEQLGENVLDLFDFAFAENGLTAYRKGKILATQSFIGWIGEEKYQRLVNYMLVYLANLKIPKKRGTFIEFRNGMVNVSPIGRNCRGRAVVMLGSHAERDEFEKYDLEHGIRRKFVEDLQREFPDYGLKYSIGGQISFDVFPIGWDKTYALQHVQNEGFKTIHFFGDKTFEGGNDFEIYHHPSVTGHAVTSPHDTIKVLHDLFLS